jgi:hypothetical protein
MRRAEGAADSGLRREWQVAGIEGTRARKHTKHRSSTGVES